MAGIDVEVVDALVVEEGNGVDVAEYGIGVSEVIPMSVSAATIPPMEWPTRITLTEGSTVGEGVFAATSISITAFWSLYDIVSDKQRLWGSMWREVPMDDSKSPRTSL